MKLQYKSSLPYRFNQGEYSNNLFIWMVRKILEIQLSEYYRFFMEISAYCATFSCIRHEGWITMFLMVRESYCRHQVIIKPLKDYLEISTNHHASDYMAELVRNLKPWTHQVCTIPPIASGVRLGVHSVFVFRRDKFSLACTKTHDSFLKTQEHILGGNMKIWMPRMMNMYIEFVFIIWLVP